MEEIEPYWKDFSQLFLSFFWVSRCLVCVKTNILHLENNAMNCWKVIPQVLCRTSYLGRLPQFGICRLLYFRSPSQATQVPVVLIVMHFIYRSCVLKMGPFWQTLKFLNQFCSKINPVTPSETSCHWSHSAPKCSISLYPPEILTRTTTGNNRNPFQVSSERDFRISRRWYQDDIKNTVECKQARFIKNKIK